MIERLVRISPDGSLVEFVYHDKVPWRELGEMESCKRASDVIFNTDTQKWDIQFFTPQDIRIEGFNTREEAIAAEVKLLEAAMK